MPKKKKKGRRITHARVQTTSTVKTWPTEKQHTEWKKRQPRENDSEEKWEDNKKEMEK